MAGLVGSNLVQKENIFLRFSWRVVEYWEWMVFFSPLIMFYDYITWYNQRLIISNLQADFPDGAHDDDNNGTRYRRAVDHYDIEMYWVSDPAMYKM